MKDSFIYFYRNMKLQSKLMVTYLIIISIPMVVIMLFFYSKVYDMIVSDTIRNEQEESAKTAPIIEHALDQVLADGETVQNLPFYPEIFHAKGTWDLQTPSALEGAEQFAGQVNEILKDSYISHVKIYVDLPASELEDLSAASGHIIESLSDMNNTHWKGIFVGTNVSSLHCPSFYLSKYEIEHYGDLAYILHKTPAQDGTSYDIYTAFYYSSDLLLDILNDTLSSKNSVAYIINDRDAIITSTNPALSSTYYLNYSTIQDSFMSSNNFLKRNILKEEIYAGMYNLKQTQWYMVVVIPSTPLIRESNQMVLQYLLLFAACIILAIGIAILISKPITKRIAMLDQQMSKVRTGPPIPLRESETHDEIGNLINTYNYMSREMNQLLKERIKSAEELRIAEFRSLQAQINPHFLYNTMDMINWMASQGRTDEIMDAVYNLSRFYKLTLSKKETLTTIADEIEHASIYIRLQNMRFHDSVEFVADLPDELLDYQIPKLTLQPVIENAVHHGIMAKDEKTGCIVLTGWIDGDMIELLVSDDGIGIPKDKLDHILTGEGRSKTGSNIAIYNTHQRIQILYGDAYGLSYHSEPGKGTDVSIRLPAQKTSSVFPQDEIIRIADDYDPENPYTTTILPDALLNYNEKLSNDVYILKDLHRISDKFSPEEPFLVLSHQVQEEFPVHTHDYFELIYCCKGTVIHEIDDMELIQGVGDIYLLNTKAVHAIKKSDMGALIINIALYPVLFETALHDFMNNDTALSRFFRTESDSDTNYLYFPLGHRVVQQIMLSSLIHEYVDADYHFTSQAAALLNDFLPALTTGNEFSPYGLTRQAADNVQYIKAHCFIDSIEKISANLYESTQSLASYLLKHTGRSLDSFINEAKINMAVELLQQPESNLVDIMNVCRFDSEDEFAAVFTEFINISPEEYRRRIL